MNKAFSLDEIKFCSRKLSERIKLFKLKHSQKEKHHVYQQNQFDIMLGNFFLILKKIFKNVAENFKIKNIILDIITMTKTLFEKIINSISKVKENSNKLVLKSKVLEKKLEDQENFIKLNIQENKELRNEIGKINSALTKILEQPENFIKNPIPDNLGHNSISKVDFYQEENVRLGSELVETKKKFEILKSEIEKYEHQRSNLISKINSVNDALNDTNVLTNVFKNKVKSKVNIIDHKKIERKSNQDLNEQVRNIFNT